MQGFLQPRPKYFAWLPQQKAADGRSFVGELAAWEARCLLAAMWIWQLGVLSRKKRRTGIPMCRRCRTPVRSRFLVTGKLICMAGEKTMLWAKSCLYRS